MVGAVVPARGSPRPAAIGTKLAAPKNVMSPPPDSLRQRVRRYYHTVSPYLDGELEGRGDERFWRRLARELDGGSVLELGTGRGRVTRMLAEAGALVVGIDVCGDMLATARRRLAHHHRVHLLAADMRELALRKRFDLVVAPNDPFTHLTEDDDRRAAIEAAVRHLAPGGVFVLDLPWLPVEEYREACGTNGLVRERTHDDGLTVRERWRCDPQTRRCATRYDYLHGDDVEESATFHARLWSAGELERRLGRVGLGIEERWGDYVRSPFDRSRSRHLVVRAAR